MSLIIILLAIFNNFAIRRPYLLSQAPHIIVRPPQSRKRGYAPNFEAHERCVWVYCIWLHEAESFL